MNAWRVVESEAQPGDWNMAIDAALMESAAVSGECCLRFYTWSAPTLSLGYFQELAARQRHAASRSCAIVRRATGGGAILHDAELTYSFAAPVGHPLAASAVELYTLFHTTLIEALADWKLSARLCEQANKLPDEPFLCFQRRAVGDVLLAEAKIAGSAQRRRRGAVLEHGSVLLQRTPYAPELFGIAEVGGVGIAAGELAQAWRERLAKKCQLSWQFQPLDDQEIKLAARYVDEIYGHSTWTGRR